MAWPPYIPTRKITVGGAYLLESAELLDVEVTVRASRSLVWQESGERFESASVTVSSQGQESSEATIELPCTDVQGWIDAATMRLIDVSEKGSYTHTYTAQLAFTRRGGAGQAFAAQRREIGPFVLPQGDGPVDIDLVLSLESSEGAFVSVPPDWTVPLAGIEGRLREAIQEELQGIRDEYAALKDKVDNLPADLTEFASRVQALEEISSHRLCNVKDFGAVGDGVTDDTASVQAAIDSGSDSVLFPSGRYRVSQIVMGNPHQSLIGMGGYGGRSHIVRTERDTTPMIRVTAEGAILRGLGIICTAATDDNIATVGVHAERLPDGPGGTQRTSVDLDIRDCYISGWRTGVEHRGQGLTFAGNTCTNLRFVIHLDFPGDNWQDVGDPNQHGPETAFRMYRLVDNRMHAIRKAFVLNDGPWATSIRTVLVDGLVADIGGEIWRGGLADALITNIAVSMTNRPWGLRLSTGSHDYVVSNVRFTGRRESAEVPESAPARFFYGEGQQENFEFRDVYLGHVRQAGFEFDGPVHSGRFRNLTFFDVGYTGNHNMILFGDPDVQATINDVEIRHVTSNTGTPIRVVGGPETDVKASGMQFTGDVIPSGGFISPVQGANANRQGAGAPSGGYWKRGDIIWRSNPSSGGTIGWICTAEGRPGSWSALPALT